MEDEIAGFDSKALYVDHIARLSFIKNEQHIKAFCKSTTKNDVQRIAVNQMNYLGIRYMGPMSYS